MTAQDLIKAALRLIGAIAQGETPTAGELNDALSSLNTMLDGWALKRHKIYARVLEGFTLTAGTGAYSIGSSVNTDRPIRIEYAYIRDNGKDHPLDLIDNDRYNAIVDKSLQGLPRYLFYNPQYSLGEVYLWPVPDKNYSLYLDSWKPFTKFQNLTDNVNFPPGYERALKYNLAVELAPEYGKPLPPEIVAVAQESLKDIQSVNAFHVEASLDVPCGNRGSFNIYTGE